MANNNKQKGNMVKLQTFLKWGVQNVFGHKIKEVDSVKYVHEESNKVSPGPISKPYDTSSNNFGFIALKL